MADVLSTSSTWSEYVQTAFDTTVNWWLRDMPMFRQIVDKHPVSQAMPGSPVTLTIEGELALATTALSESVDVDAVVAADPRQVSVTPVEYGNAIMHTLKLRQLDFTAATVKRIGQQIAFNQADSIDRLVRNVIDGATNIIHSTSDSTAGILGTTLLPPTKNFNTYNAAAAVSQLRSRRAPAREGEVYMAYIHPDVAYDLRLATGTNAWVAPHTYSDTSNFYAGEVGMIHGARYVETNRCAHNQTQVVTIDATGGTFTLTYAGQTTSATAYNASAATLQTNLNALSTIGASGVGVTGNAGGPYTVNFSGTAFAGAQPAALTGSGASLTGGGSTVTITGVYSTYYFGREGLLEATCVEPHVVVGTVVDKLQRFVPIGWHAMLGWTIFRQNSLEIVKSLSSIASLNAATYDPKA